MTVETDQEALRTLGFSPQRLLGEGSMGRVFEVIDLERDRRIAVKLTQGLDEEHLARFQREATLNLSLRHPHLVAGLGVRRRGSRLALIMEFVPAPSLESLHARTPQLPIDGVLLVMEQIARALAYLHEQGVVHRDVKPGNVLVDVAKRWCWLCDLGIAKDMESATLLTHSDTALGTLSYLPPEALMRETPQGPPGDVYSLGATAYELLTGTPVFSARNLADLAHLIVQQEAPDVRLLRTDVGAQLASLLRAMLVKNPLQRPAAAELVSGIVALRGSAQG